MIGIICAEQKEINEILKLMTNKNEENFRSFKFIKGEINNHDCTAVLSGVGKVSSAICTQVLIFKYSPDIILNVGVAGGISEKINIGDVVIANNVVQHDFDVSIFPNRKRGEIPALSLVQIPCSTWVIEKILNSAKSISNVKVHNGTIVSGDQFINCPNKLLGLNTDFGGIACEMEAGAIGQTCFVNKVDFGIIRSISDNANSDAKINFEEFIEQSSMNAASILSAFIRSI
ncbi:MAG: 5'-methylthioadenosine/adenosylhomocysteine nucleosidase [Oscillospiraceae bacterium]|nr:5'-methylthioadenosine/adenosylhomocysteine nucleosidase [Oscillospiraceae bacterium]